MGRSNGGEGEWKVNRGGKKAIRLRRRLLIYNKGERSDLTL